MAVQKTKRSVLKNKYKVFIKNKYKVFIKNKKVYL